LTSKNGVAIARLQTVGGRITTPGDLEITASITRPGKPALTASTSLKVVGSPSSVYLDVNPATMTEGAPVSVIFKVADAAGQPVCDETPVFYRVDPVDPYEFPDFETVKLLGHTYNGQAGGVFKSPEQGTHLIQVFTGGWDNQDKVIQCVIQTTTFSTAKPYVGAAW
jgi:hypothetical protein